MDNLILVAIIGALAGLISGAFASLIAPWINWGIDKKKLLLNERRILLKEVRELIIKEYHEHENFTKNIAINKNYTKENVLYPNAITYFDTLSKYPQFLRLLPFINEALIKLLKKSKLLNLSDRGSALGEMPIPYSELIQSLNDIEKTWNLI